jgi:hypothetical protein
MAAVANPRGLFGWVLDRASDWVHLLELAHKLKDLDGNAARRMLEDEGVISPREILSPDAEIRARILPHFLHQLDLDPIVIRRTHPDLMRELESTCVLCTVRSRCEQDLERGCTRATYRDFCPNADRIDAVRHERLRHFQPS